MSPLGATGVAAFDLTTLELGTIGGGMAGLDGLDRRDAIGIVDLRSAPTTAPDARPAPVPATADPVVHAVAALVPSDRARSSSGWLTPRERAAAERRGERGRPGHVAGRVAAKQAVLAHLVHAGFAEPEPDRIEIANDPLGRPTVAVRGARVATRHLCITIAHTTRVAVAAATIPPAGRGADRTAVAGIGIDVEPVEPRSARFAGLTLTTAEQALAPIAGDDRDTWLTRLWAAKEAAAKATGRGLEGRPKAFETTAVDGERLRVAGRWITTEIATFAGVDHVVAITEATRTERAWRPS